ncbi:CTP synthase [Colletotrichum orbiculare MAFF 240422]|uniref:CTP synthase n=1 Tax=Colletotrichum orbiculare (strain 104-T / ATCC 96160 / CBS 514.97 / LARS 414 / MAFF 240422) TaxID=1213857 RepID=N4UZL9_COLOR|nr:CTP synthase [Colletotrichum orbiculare MAFF 240422]
MRYVLVSGGVISGVGKGIIASSTGLLLKTLGLRVTSIKIDPYLSVDAGLMAPAEHGECFVLQDGMEVDLDLGNYERYLNIRLTGEHNITTGKVYRHVIEKERRGDYLGKTVQVVPHVTDAIQDWIERVAKIPTDDSGEEPDVCIIELGGTVGDIESMPYVEALTQLRHRAGSGNFIQIHVSYVPTIHGEQKTKPTQHAVKTVRSYGLIPDLIACRCEQPLMEPTIRKIALLCQVDVPQVLVVRDMPTIYQVPLLLSEQGLIPWLRKAFNLDSLCIPASRVADGESLRETWTEVVSRASEGDLNIALVGKYTQCQDAYLSVVKSLEHSSMHLRKKLNIIWVDAEHLEPKAKSVDQAEYHKAWHSVCTAAGIIVPGGFGTRGTEGMMAVSKWARENGTPFLGVCLGFQTAVIQYARDFLNVPTATSEEFNAQASEKVVIYMPELSRDNLGGTMRLGLRPTEFQAGSEWSKLRALYGQAQSVEERHRHRYEVNPAYVDKLTEAGLEFIGKDDTGERMEIFELKSHPYFVGTQFHAEYQSKVLSPSRPFLGFVAAAAGCLDRVIKDQLATANQVNGVKHAI